ncbi:MAG TPA: VanZ family protein [Gemmatimonadales bacterium]|nr:VanZ family protein [Gemmatimonadales bacterium]
MMPTKGWRRTVWHLVLTILVVKFIADLTLHSARVYPTRSTFLCLWGCGDEELRDFISNILLFIPLGWVLRYWVSPRLAFLLATGATIGIETAQAFLLTGRDPSLRDILTNCIGAALGIWFYAHWRGIVYPDQRTSRRFAAVGLGGWCLVLILTGIGLHPTGSRHPWFGFWANEIESYAPYDGEVRTVEIGDWVPPAGPLPDDNPLKQAIIRDSIDLHVVAINRTVTRPTALIFAVMDEFDNEMLFVGGAWRSIQFQARTRFSEWGLRDLSFRLPLSPGSEPNDTLDITARVRPGTWRLRLASQGTVKELALPLSVGLGWTTLLPAHLSTAYERYVMNPFWLAVLLFPGVYWHRRARPTRGLPEAGVIIALALVLVPLATHVAPSTIPDWIGGALGLVIGTLFARRSLTRHPAA